MVPFPLTSRLLHRRKVKKAGFVGESPFPLGFSAKLDLAKPIEISLAWNRTLKANGRPALESVLLTAGSELRELGVVVNP